MATHPPVVQSALMGMSNDQKLIFEAEYQRQSRTKGLLIVLAIIFPIQLFLLGKTGLGLIFWLTIGGFLIWWIIEIFLTSGRVDDYNARVATDIARDLKIMT